MLLKMASYGHGEGILAGSIEGRKAFADLVQKTQTPGKPEVFFLDFAGIDVVTTSFLRDGPLAYRNFAREHWPYVYPVAANLSAKVFEEFDGWLTERGDAFVICRTETGEDVTDVRLIGQIDGKVLIALQHVIAQGEIDVNYLADQDPEKVAKTAWNNRLAALAAKGVVIEFTSGRSKRYRPVLEGLKYGS